MIELTYRGIDGSEWSIVGDGQGLEGAVATGVEGFVAEPDVTLEYGATSLGQVATGYSLPPMKGTLTLGLSTRWDRARASSLSDVHARLGRAWSRLADGELVWRDSAGVVMRTRARLASAFPTPKKAPASLGLTDVEVALSVVCLDGVWRGAEEPVGSGDVLNPGDLPLYPAVAWSGYLAQVAGPGMPLFNLPTTTSTAVWDSDPATGGVVWVGDTVATALRRQMRGRVAPLPIAAGTTAPWVFSKCTGIVRPLYTNPWGR